MSIKLMAMVWDSSIQTSQKMALLAMCDWADDEGGSVYPSIAKLAKRISCSERQAQRIVHGLIDDGLVAVVGNALGGVPGQSRQYRINVKALFALSLGASVGQTKPTSVPLGRGDILSPVESDQKQGVGVTPMTPTGDMGVTLSPLYPSLNTPLPPDGGASGFEELWNAYPKKAAEAKARRQWDRLAPDLATFRAMVDAVRIQSATENWRKDGGQYVPMLSTWLRDRRWLDCLADPMAVAAAVLGEDTRAGVEQLAARLGVAKWDSIMEQWPTFKARVLAAKLAAEMVEA
jgi:hypothetical protein